MMYMSMCREHGQFFHPLVASQGVFIQWMRTAPRILTKTHMTFKNGINWPSNDQSTYKYCLQALKNDGNDCTAYKRLQSDDVDCIAYKCLQTIKQSNSLHKISNVARFGMDFCTNPSTFVSLRSSGTTIDDTIASMGDWLRTSDQSIKVTWMM